MHSAQHAKICRDTRNVLTSQTVSLTLCQTTSLVRSLRMDVTAKDVPDAELAVLRVLWDRGASTIRQLTDVLYPGGSDSHYATVQKLLERLEAKGCVSLETSSRAHTFQASI